MTTYFKLINHSELKHFWQERLLAYYDPQVMSTLHYPRSQTVIQPEIEIALFQYISPTSQVVTHLVRVTGPRVATGAADFPWKSEVEVIKSLDPAYFRGLLRPTSVGWPGAATGQSHGAAGGPPQIWPGHGAGAVRLGHLLGAGHQTIRGLRRGIVYGQWNGASITPTALQTMILNNPAYQ
jgi:hypothetical protein